MSMNMETAKLITDIWEKMEAANPDRSTEWLLEATAYAVQNKTMFRNADAGDVAEALMVSGNVQPTKNPTSRASGVK